MPWPSRSDAAISLACLAGALLLCAIPDICAAAPPGAAISSARHGPPDLSGVWTAYVEPGAPTFGLPRTKLPLTPLGSAKVADYRSLIGPDDSPGAYCLGSGMPEAMMFSGLYPMEIIQRPEQITIIYEAHNEVRRLYFGSKIIAPGDRIPDREGYSTARWEGDTLVVTTSSLKEQEDQAYPHSAQARLEERYHVFYDAKGAKVLEADWTLTDPTFYTRPFSATKRWAYDPHGVLLPYECNEEAWLDHLQQLRQRRDAARAHSAALDPQERSP
jgi:hypothetical protein